MSVDDPEVTTVTSKGQITIPSRLRDQFGLEKGTKLMVVPTDYGLVLKKSNSRQSRSSKSALPNEPRIPNYPSTM